MKKIVSMFLTLALCFICFSMNVFAKTSFKEQAVESVGICITPFSVSQTGTIALGSGQSFSVDFNMNVWGDSPHNAFDVSATSISRGSYYIGIMGSNGYTYTSKTYSGPATVTISNAQPGVTYTATFTAGSKPCDGKYSIFSYYK